MNGVTTGTMPPLKRTEYTTNIIQKFTHVFE